jgi:hypothetical protein
VPLAGVDYESEAVASSGGVGKDGWISPTPYVIEMDVTSSLRKWSAGQANHGWILQPVSVEDVSVAASEQISDRPRLTVETVCRVPSFPEPFDVDEDGDVDLDDYADFASCLTGPGAGVAPACRDLHDADGDGDVDLIDFGLFQLASSSTRLPVCD